MMPDSRTEQPLPTANLFSSADVESVLRRQGWLDGEVTPEMRPWLHAAAAWLGPQVSLAASLAKSEDALVRLLHLIFSYEARSLLHNPENQALLAWQDARDLIRELAHGVLAGGEIDSDRYREIIEILKAKPGLRGRQLFYPVRLALAGRTGEGELDRVILLLDRAAKLDFSRPVKGTRQRIVEFCAALS